MLLMLKLNQASSLSALYSLKADSNLLTITAAFGANMFLSNSFLRFVSPYVKLKLCLSVKLKVTKNFAALLPNQLLISIYPLS